jgi:hypothetical protein
MNVFGPATRERAIRQVEITLPEDSPLAMRVIADLASSETKKIEIKAAEWVCSFFSNMPCCVYYVCSARAG